MTVIEAIFTLRRRIMTSLCSMCDGINDEGAEELAKNTSLTTLQLYSNSITDKGAAALMGIERLSSLYIARNDLTRG